MVFISMLSSSATKFKGQHKKNHIPAKIDKRAIIAQMAEKKNTRTSTVMTPVKHFQRHLKWPEQNENNQINNDRMGIYRHMRVCYVCDGR